MSRIREALGHPFWQAVLVCLVAYALFTWGIQYLPPLVGVRSAPVPQTVVLQYMLMVIGAVLLYVSGEEERWSRFRAPMRAVLVDPDKSRIRGLLLVLLPLGIGLAAYGQARPTVSAPVQLRSIHPAPPGTISFRGKTINLTGLENPLRTRGDVQEHYREGRRVYYRNCLPCHGDLLDGKGQFAHGFSPTPLAFDDPGTIAQLTESYVFWRIAKGGPGLPREGAPWDSAMPVWEDMLTEDEIWAVIIYIYEQTGFQPRRWEAAAEGGKHD